MGKFRWKEGVMPAVSKAQKTLMSMAKGYKMGKLSNVGPEVKKVAMGMNMKQLEDFTKTPSAGLPARTPVLKRTRKGLARVKYIA